VWKKGDEVRALTKIKITSASTKIRQYVGKSIARRQNNLFKNNQARLYKELSGNGRKTEAAIPNADEAQGFWKGIWSEKKEHDKEASWLGGIREELNKVERQEDIVLRLEDVKAGIKPLDQIGSEVTGSKDSRPSMKLLPQHCKSVCYRVLCLSGWSRGGQYLSRRTLRRDQLLATTGR